MWSKVPLNAKYPVYFLKAILIGKTSIIIIKFTRMSLLSHFVTIKLCYLAGLSFI